MRSVDRVRADHTSVSLRVRQKETYKAPGEKTSGAFAIVQTNTDERSERSSHCE
jgi:hypothetical protein